MHKKALGLTLIELVVVIAIVGVLAIIGIPAYKTYLVESRRSDGINAMRENQLTVEQYIQSNGITPTSGQVTLLSTSKGGFYTLSYTRVNDNRYKIEATAVSGKSQAGDTGCTTLTLISEMDGIYPAKCY